MGKASKRKKRATIGEWVPQPGVFDAGPGVDGLEARVAEVLPGNLDFQVVRGRYLLIWIKGKAAPSLPLWMA